MKKYLFLIFFIGIFNSAFSYDLVGSMGNICDFVGKIQTNANNDSTNICSFNPVISFSYDHNYFSRFKFSYELTFSIPKSGQDENVSTMEIATLVNAKYPISKWDLNFGAGLFFKRISGAGGEEILNNGTTTDSFPMPASTIYTRNFILNLGTTFHYDEELSCDLSSYIFNFIKNEERAFSILFKISYHFGEFK